MSHANGAAPTKSPQNHRIRDKGITKADVADFSQDSTTDKSRQIVLNRCHGCLSRLRPCMGIDVCWLVHLQGQERLLVGAMESGPGEAIRGD